MKSCDALMTDRPTLSCQCHSCVKFWSQTGGFRQELAAAGIDCYRLITGYYFPSPDGETGEMGSFEPPFFFFSTVEVGWSA